MWAGGARHGVGPAHPSSPLYPSGLYSGLRSLSFSDGVITAFDAAFACLFSFIACSSSMCSALGALAHMNVLVFAVDLQVFLLARSDHLFHFRLGLRHAWSFLLLPAPRAM